MVMIDMVNAKLDNDTELDALLNERYTPSLPEGLAERIIAESHRAQKKAPAKVSLWNRMRGITAEFGDFFLLPKPAYALAFCLLIGIAAGFEAQSQMSAGDTDWSSFLNVNEDWI